MRKHVHRVYWLLGIGVILVGGAWIARPHISIKRPAAVSDPRTQALQAEAARLQQTVAAAPKDVKSRWRLADLFQQMGRLDLAAAQLDSIRRLQPKDPEPQLALVNTRLALGQFKQAEDLSRALVREKPGMASAWMGLAAALFQQTRYREALDAARHALKLSPADPNSHYVLATSALEDAMQYADSSVKPGELALARSEMEELVKAWPQNGLFYYSLGRACIGQQDWKAAIRYLGRAVQLAPTPNAYRNLGSAHLSMGDHIGARKVAEEGAARYPGSASLHDLLGQCLGNSPSPPDSDRSLAEFQKAVQLDPQNELFQERLGTAYLRKNRLQDARAAFERASQLDPNRLVPYQQLSGIYTSLGDVRSATAAAVNARSMFFNMDQLTKVKSTLMEHPDSVPLHLILADRYRDMNLLVPARDEYLEVLRLDLANKRAQEGLARLAAQHGTPSSDAQSAGSGRS